MATSQPVLAAGRGLVAIRGTLLGDDGSRAFCGQADTSFYSMCPQSISGAETTEAGEQQTLRCGSGDAFATFTTDDITTGQTLTIVMAAIDIEAIILMTGATPLIEAGDVIGWSGGQSFGDPFELHAWAEAYSGSAAATPNYWHHVWPFVTAKLSPVNLVEGFQTVTITAKVQANAVLGNGSFLDIPVQAFESTDEFHAAWRDSDEPDPLVAPYNNGLGGGFIATPACAS